MTVESVLVYDWVECRVAIPGRRAGGALVGSLFQTEKCWQNGRSGCETGSKVVREEVEGEATKGWSESGNVHRGER